MKHNFNEIPIIDVSILQNENGDLSNLSKEIARASEHVGFFYIRGHGISPSIFENLMQQMEYFFSLPIETKSKVYIKDSPYMRGYFGPGDDRSDEVNGDIKEGFDLALEVAENDPYVLDNVPFYGPNNWPQELPMFRKHVSNYYNSMLALGFNLLKAFALGLDQSPDYFSDKFEKPMAQLRLLKYPPSISETEPLIGAGEHTDFGWITMIYQDKVGGLEVKNSSGEWIAAPYLPDTFVVNVGDLMERWTNGKYSATMHRVLNRSRMSRYSAAFFMDPNYFTNIKAIPSCISKAMPPQYEEISAGDYMNMRFFQTTEFRVKPETV